MPPRRWQAAHLHLEGVAVDRRPVGEVAASRPSDNLQLTHLRPHILSPRRDATMKITNEVLEAHLNCKTKSRLKLAGESGTPSDYEVMTTEARQASREEALAKLVARFPDACEGVTVTATTLKEGKPLLADATLEDDA